MIELEILKDMIGTEEKIQNIKTANKEIIAIIVNDIAEDAAKRYLKSQEIVNILKEPKLILTEHHEKKKKRQEEEEQAEQRGEGEYWYKNEITTATLVEEKDDDEKRKEKARTLEKSWELVRSTREILKNSGEKWEKRRKDETERIKKEEKEERLRVVQLKKRKYMTKEDTKKLK